MKHLLILPLVLLAACSPQAPHSSAEGGDGHAEPEALSPQALASLDLQVQALVLTNFTAAESVRATVELHPLGIRPLVAPYGGRVTGIRVQPGDGVDQGDVLFSIVRDALPVVELTATAELLQPGSEALHEAAAALRSAFVEHEIAEKELARLRALNAPSGDHPVVPRQRVVELEYALARSEKEIAVLEGRLQLHGFSERQVKLIQDGKPVRLRQARWKETLMANGLWSKDAESLWSVLPKEKGAWVIGAIGELALRNQISSSLVTWLEKDRNAAANFSQMAGLLQQGYGVDFLKRLHADGGFTEKMAVRVPVECAKWELQMLSVRVGERVESGQVLGTLVDPRHLLLKATPVGREIPLVHEAAANGLFMTAHPLVAGAGPNLTGLKIERVRSVDPVEAWIPVSNQVLSERGTVRQWALLPGTAFEVSVPTETWEKVWQVPVGALAEQGADTVVFVQNGDDYAPVKVSVRFRNNRVAVLDTKTDLFPGDHVVTRNAFGLALALASRGGQVIDPHAGHNH